MKYYGVWRCDGIPINKEHEFFKKCAPLNEEKYAQINKDRLVLYAAYLLEKSGIEPTFEKIVATSFKLFPKRFSLLGFPEYPDARWIYYSLWHCVYPSKGWLSGSTKSGYQVTPEGKTIVSETMKALSGKIFTPRKVASRQKRKEMYFLDLVEKSSAFQKYVSGKADDITEMEIRIVLRTRKDTPSDVVRLNFKKFQEYAEVADKGKILEFFGYIAKSDRWVHLFGG